MSPKKLLSSAFQNDNVDHFNRLELKYLIPNSRIGLFAAELERYMEYDEYSSAVETGYYPVYSVYFDTFDMHSFNTKLSGVQHRKKYRVRSYYKERAPGESVMLEIKEKDNLNVFKRRTKVTLAEAQNMALESGTHQDNPICHEWRHANLRYSLRPKIMVAYRRKAYAAKEYPGLRITFDRDVSFAVTDTIAFNQQTTPTDWARKYSVMELKFNGFVPNFVIDLIHKYNLSNESVSKYCDSVVTKYQLNT